MSDDGIDDTRGVGPCHSGWLWPTFVTVLYPPIARWGQTALPHLALDIKVLPVTFIGWYPQHDSKRLGARTRAYSDLRQCKRQQE